MGLISELDKEIFEEEVASKMYQRLAEEARSAGHTSEANLLYEIAIQESGHAIILRQVVDSIIGKRREEPEMLGGVYWEVTNMVTGEILQYHEKYPTTDHAVRAAKDYLEAEFSQFRGQHLVIKVFNESPEERYGPPYVTYTPIRTESYWVGEPPTLTPSGERWFAGPEPEFPSRPFPKTYGDWVNLVEDIKDKVDTSEYAEVNSKLGIIGGLEEGDAEEAKRWLMLKAGELGIK